MLITFLYALKWVAVYRFQRSYALVGELPPKADNSKTLSDTPTECSNSAAQRWKTFAQRASAVTSQSKSPSSGMERVKVILRKGSLLRKTGLASLPGLLWMHFPYFPLRKKAGFTIRF
jgi:uncharacterized protein YbbK (DUF523 family)